MKRYPQPADAAIYLRLARLTKAYWPHIAGILLLEILSTFLTLLIPVPLKIAVDSLLQGAPVPPYFSRILPAPGPDPRPLLIGVCVLSLLITLLNQLQSLFSDLLTTYSGENLTLSLRSRLFKQAQRLSLTYHTEKGTADALYRIQSDATAIQWIIIEGLIPFVSSTFALLSMLYVILRLDAKIGMVALVVSPLLFLLSRTARPLLRGMSREVKRQESLALGIVQEVLGILGVVKAFVQEDRERKRYANQAQRCVRGRVKISFIEGGIGLAINLVMAAGMGLVLYIGVEDVLAKKLELGSLLLILNYVSKLYTPLKTLSRKIVSLQSQFASMERVFSFLDLPADTPERADALPLRRSSGPLVFENVAFAYEAERPVLRGVSFEAKPGDRIGVLGSTGSGKTTMTQLMLRFADPIEGRILLDGMDLRDFKLDDLRNQFAVVFQETVLFAASFAENIAYGRPDAHREEIEEAAKAANIHEFILQSPEGYDTIVGERGLKLSGGERQRVGLARAFLKDAPILILDEPTSAIDVQTEAQIMEAIERLMHGRMTFIIAHRLNTLSACDLLLVLQEGGVEVVRHPADFDYSLAYASGKNG
jgi:ATP-binding cassette subfamily B protein